MIAPLLPKPFSKFLEHVHRHLGFYAVGTIVLFSSLMAWSLNEQNAEAAQEKKEEALLKEFVDLQKKVTALHAKLKQRAKETPRVAHQVSLSPKRRFVSSVSGEGFKSLNLKREAVYIPMGSVFKARLLTTIKTSIQETFVMAQTTRSFEMDSSRRLPAGTKLIGRAALNPALKGVVVRFHHLVLPNGKERVVSLLALNEHAMPELQGIHFSNEFETYATALSFGFLAGFADAGREREVTAFGSAPTSSLQNRVLGGLSTASFQVAEDILSDIKDRALEYVVVPAGKEIYVALEKRFSIERDGS